MSRSSVTSWPSRSAQPDVVGQEAWQGVHLDDHQQAAGVECGVEVAEHALRIGDMVQRRGRPRDVHRTDLGPGHVQVGLHDAQQIGQPCLVVVYLAPVEVVMMLCHAPKIKRSARRYLRSRTAGRPRFPDPVPRTPT